MFSHVHARAVSVGLLAVAMSLSASAGPADSPVRRFDDRGAASSSTSFAAAREAVYQHLKTLGIPLQDLREGLRAVDGLAQQSVVRHEDLSSLADLAPDMESSAKAYSILTAYAELAAFGQPVTEDLAVDGFPVIRASQPPSVVDGVALETVEEDYSGAVPKIGGICLTCPNFDFGPFTPTPVYQTHSNQLVGGSDCAWYQFNVVAGNRYEFSTCPPGSTLGDWNSVLELYDPASSCLSFVARNDAGCGNPSLLFWDATFTGVVHVKLKPATLATAPGPYTLAYRSQGIVCETCTVPNVLPLAAPTGGCQCISDSTNTICLSDYWQVPLVMGETYEFTTCPVSCPAATAAFDTVLRLWEPAGCTVVATNDDATGCGTRSTITYTPAYSGMYRIQVTGRQFSTGLVVSGTYTLCYKRTSAACPTCQTGPYQIGMATVPGPACQSHASTVTACQANWYDFTLTAGRTYEFGTCPAAPGTCPLGSATFDSVIEIYDAACGVVLASDDDGCSAGLQSVLTYTPGANGTYRVRVRGKTNADMGPYVFTYRDLILAPCTAPTSISFSPASGIADGTCSRNETFNVSVDASATSPITYTWSILPPAGGSAFPPNGVTMSIAPAGAPASFNSSLQGAGTYIVSVNATNACGGFMQNFAYQLIDNQVPTVSAAPDAAVSCSAVPPPAPPAVADNCDASPSVVFNEVRIDGPCEDTYQLQRTWTATDDFANAASDTQTIDVSDTTPPVLVGLPADVAVDCSSVPAPAPVTATDDCDPNPALSFSETTIAGSCPGNYTLQRTWTAEDRCGNESTFTQVVAVTDTTAPVITPNESQIACLWPPNHQFACFGMDAVPAPAVTEDCSEPVTYTIVGVTSTSGAAQPCGDGGPNHDPDVIIAPDGQGFCVRAERCGQDRASTTGGRTYSVQAVATDACGNVSAPATIGSVFVPHDQRGGLACQRAETRFNP